eukprot:1140139-Pelagomonas_calceolata.AAC.3
MKKDISIYISKSGLLGQKETPVGIRRVASSRRVPRPRPSTTKNMWSALKDPLASYDPSQNVIIWIAPSTFSQVANAPSFVTW